MDQELDGKEKVGMEKEEMMEIGAGEQNGRGPDQIICSPSRDNIDKTVKTCWSRGSVFAMWRMTRTRSC